MVPPDRRWRCDRRYIDVPSTGGLAEALGFFTAQGALAPDPERRIEEGQAGRPSGARRRLVPAPLGAAVTPCCRRGGGVAAQGCLGVVITFVLEENKFEKAAAAATPKSIIWNLTAI